MKDKVTKIKKHPIKDANVSCLVNGLLRTVSYKLCYSLNGVKFVRRLI